MALVINSPTAANNKIGPGHLIRVTQQPTVDYGAGSFWRISLSFQIPAVNLTIEDHPYTTAELRHRIGGPTTFDRTVPNIGNNYNNNPGDTCVLAVALFNPSTVLQEFIQQNQSWDPTGQLYQLFWAYQTTVDLTEVLNAVRKTYQNTA